MTQRCKPPSALRCKYGYEWNELSGECHNNRLHGSNLKVDPTPDRLLEPIGAIIVFVVMVLLLYCMKKSSYRYSFEPQTDQRINWRRYRRSRTSSLDSPRIIHLRVNLESHDSHRLDEESVINVSPNPPRSASSLPPYEFLFNCGASADSQLPPYSSAPPTYEEAMALVKSEKIDISAKFDSK
jgi:hypothetical protein